MLLFFLRTMKSDIAKHTFLKRKLEIVKREEFEDRLQTHIYQKVCPEQSMRTETRFCSQARCFTLQICFLIFLDCQLRRLFINGKAPRGECVCVGGGGGSPIYKVPDVVL